MENSFVLAKFIGAFIVVIAIGLLANLKTYKQVMSEVSKNFALIYLSGLFTFLIGLTIVIYHNIWVMDWRLIITLFGWMALIKGIWLIVFPGSVAKMASIYIRDIKLAVIPWMAMFAIGIYLMIKGF